MVVVAFWWGAVAASWWGGVVVCKIHDNNKQ